MPNQMQVKGGLFSLCHINVFSDFMHRFLSASGSFLYRLTSSVVRLILSKALVKRKLTCLSVLAKININLEFLYVCVRVWVSVSVQVSGYVSTPYCENSPCSRDQWSVRN